MEVSDDVIWGGGSAGVSSGRGLVQCDGSTWGVLLWLNTGPHPVAGLLCSSLH